MPAVEVEQLVVRYGDVVAVDELSLTARAGEVTTILGPNGAGKTSTIETLEGYRRPTQGSVRVLGLDPIADHHALTARMGVMLQRGGIYPGIRVGEAARLFCALYDHRRAADELLELVGLSDKSGRTWKQLSGGEQQRLSLALALAGCPDVAFLDEPTAGLDVSGRQVVRRVVRALADEGTAVVLTTHELDEAERLSDRVLIVDHGRLVAEGTTAELMAKGAGHEIRFGAPAGIDITTLGARLGGAVVEASAGEYVAAVAATPENVAALTAWLAENQLPLADLRAGRQRLEDVFLRLTTEGTESSLPTSRRRR
ncbi:MAG: ABC transporter ATP-binding protein [Acidimicrobiales bacterium]